MSPRTFLQRPALWFDVMQRVRATHTGGANFAFDLSVQRTTPEQRRRWDLRSLEVVMSGAEPIREETKRSFLEAFAVSGLRPETFCPAYGLAEHTVGVSAAGKSVLRLDREALSHGEVRPADGDAPATVVLGCGRPLAGVEVRIVDPETLRPCPGMRVGEIWVDSPCKAKGYLGLEEATRQTFQARVAEETESREYLRTGDLGFLYEGEVHVTGRIKDLIIVRGRNIYPQDIELSAAGATSLISPRDVVAFGIEDAGGERIVVVAEAVDPVPAGANLADAAEAIRQRVIEHHQQACAAIVIGRPGTVPRTSGGKVRRHACREAFLSGRLQSAPSTLHVGTYKAASLAAAVQAEPGKPGQTSLADPRVEALEAGFQRTLVELLRLFGMMTARRTGRLFHKSATTARGTLTVVQSPEFPPHGFFAPGGATRSWSGTPMASSTTTPGPITAGRLSEFSIRRRPISWIGRCWTCC